MAKDPAALFYIDHWLAATREMRADCRGWYINLVLHQFKSGSLPNDIEELANLASVRVSEFEVFQQVFQQVLKQKFEVLSTGRLQDIEAAEIIRAREDFKDKRAAAGRISAFITFIRKKLCSDENVLFFIKQHVDHEQLRTNNQQVLKQVYEDLFQLYINRNKDKDRIENEVGGTGGEAGGREGGSDGDPPGGWKEGDWNNFQLEGSRLPAEMMQILLGTFPEYPLQEFKDHPACWQFAYSIADYRGWKWQSVLNGSGEKLLSEWREIVTWARDDPWYKTKSVSFWQANFQGLIQAKNNGTPKGPGAAKGYSGRGPTNGIDPTEIEREGAGKL